MKHLHAFCPQAVWNVIRLSCWLILSYASMLTLANKLTQSFNLIRNDSEVDFHKHDFNVSKQADFVKTKPNI